MDVLDLYAKISLDKSEYDKGLDDASQQSSSFGSKLAGGLGSAVKTVAKVGAAAVGVASTAVIAMTKSAVSSFAEYEQLVGGVETLFGNSADFVQERASVAFETAGLSANQYMETVTSFSASLLQSLGGDTAEAAKVADQAIIDMSDNANKMGSSMESIQNAYQGFAKQNYTMLDNLKLGYGGTKEEMQRLLDDAGKLANTKFNISSYADVINAIHVIQENMGIAGTTAEEAATTISGSLGMVKASWANMLTAIGEGDMTVISESIGNLVTSAQTFGQNVIPVVQRSLTGIVELIGALAPEIAAVIPSLVSDILPTIIDAGIQIVGALGAAIMDNIDTLVFAAYDIIEMLFNAMLEATSGEGTGIITQIFDWILGAFQENYMTIVDVGVQIIANLIDGISQSIPQILPLFVDVVMDIAQHLIDNTPLLLDAGIQLILGLADGLIEALPLLIERLPELIQSIVDAIIEGLPLLIDGAIQLVTGLVAALPEIIQAIVEALPQIIDAVVQGLLAALPQLIDGVVQLNLALAEALPEIMTALVEAIPQIIESIVTIIIESAPLLLDAFMQIFAAVGEMIMTTGASWGESMGGVLSNLVQTAVTWLQQLPERAAYFAGQMVAQTINAIINLPNKIAETFNNVITNLKNFGQNFITEAPRIANQFKDGLINIMKGIPSKMIEIGKDIVNGLKNGISNAWSSFKEWMKGLVGDFIQGVKDNLKIGSPSRVMADEIGKWIPAGIALGVENNAGTLFDSIDSLVSDIVPSINPLSDLFSGNLANVSAIPTGEQPIINVYVTLEGDADRLFRVVESKATSNYRLTGRDSLVTV